MAVSLVKGANISLDKEAPGLKTIMIGLGWDARATDGAEFDLDASVFMLAENDKVKQPKDFIFYNNLASSDGSVVHTGDNRTGDGEGDDESIKVDLPTVPNYVRKITVTVTIHDADVRRQNFGMVSNAFMRIVDTANNKELARFDLTEDMSTETAMIFGEVYRHNSEWKFKAVGQGFAGGLRSLCLNYGLKV
jgi:tellurium resistance protein TerD